MMLMVIKKMEKRIYRKLTISVTFPLSIPELQITRIKLMVIKIIMVEEEVIIIMLLVEKINILVLVKNNKVVVTTITMMMVKTKVLLLLLLLNRHFTGISEMNM